MIKNSEKQDKKVSRISGFTLIELLVVVSITAILLGISIFGLTGARRSSRDARRKADLELLRSGLEIYKADCNFYPAALSSPLIGDDSTSTCLSANTYINSIPVDPRDPLRTYIYSSSGLTYELCASLEGETSATENCGGSPNCGETCNYKAISP